MSLSPEQVADRIEINDLLIRYTCAIDQKDWVLLDSCFTPDAHLDYTSAGGIAGDYAKVRAWLEQALAPFPMTIHYVTNSVVQLDPQDRDRATARTAVFNPMGLPGADGGLQVFHVGAYYNDRLVRTPAGWRIRERIEETTYMDGNLPPGLPAKG